MKLQKHARLLFAPLVLLLPLATIGCAEHHYYRAYDPYYNDYHRWDNTSVSIISSGSSKITVTHTALTGSWIKTTTSDTGSGAATMATMIATMTGITTGTRPEIG